MALRDSVVGVHLISFDGARPDASAMERVGEVCDRFVAGEVGALGEVDLDLVAFPLLRRFGKPLGEAKDRTHVQLHDLFMHLLERKQVRICEHRWLCTPRIARARLSGCVYRLQVLEDLCTSIGVLHDESVMGCADDLRDCLMGDRLPDDLLRRFCLLLDQKHRCPSRAMLR